MRFKRGLADGDKLPSVELNMPEGNRNRDVPIALGLFLLALLVYRLSWPGNQHEAEDAYLYALQVADQNSHPTLWHRHHNLFIPLMKAAYRGICRAGLTLSSFEWLSWVSTISGALTVSLTYLLARRRQRICRDFSLITAATVMFCYGFWRYSCTPETYAPAASLCLLFIYLVSAVPGSRRSFFAAVLAGSVAIGFHAVSAAAVLFASPVLLWLQKRKREAVILVLLVGGVTACHYYLAFLFPAPPETAPAGIELMAAGQPEEAGGAGGFLPPLTSFAVAGLAFPQALVAPGFLLGVPAFREWLDSYFASRNMTEELFLGRNLAGTAVVDISFVTFAMIAVLVAWSLWAFRRGEPDLKQALRQNCIPALLIWFALSAGAVFLTEPGNPELWVLALVPFCISAAFIFFKHVPRQAAAVRSSILISALALHNWFGGMLLLQNPDYDLNLKVAELANKVVRHEDLVLTARSEITERYLAYLTEAECLNIIAFARNHRLRLKVPGPYANIYATGDVFDPPLYLKSKRPRAYKHVLQFSVEYRNSFCPVASNKAAVLYRWCCGDDR
jgi:hypothetical protein